MQAPLRTDRVNTKSKFGVACFFGALSGQPGVPRSPTLRHRHGIFTCEVGPSVVFTALSGSCASNCFNIEENIQQNAGTSSNVPHRDVELCFLLDFRISPTVVRRIRSSIPTFHACDYSNVSSS
jgi:hypothetical protein